MAYKDPNKCKEYNKAYREAHKEYAKAWREAHKEHYKDYQKVWKETNKEHYKDYQKAWQEAHKDEYKEYNKAYHKDYHKADVNALGQTKGSIRMKSNHYLKKYGTKIEGYQIHHCCTYNEPYKFIYCTKEMHRLIHSYLRQHNIDADSDHYKYIKHLLDDSVIKYNVE